MLLLLVRLAAFLRAHGGMIAAEIAANFVFPYVAYVLAQPRLGDTGGLLVSSLPPILWSLVAFVRARRVDAVSLFVLSGIVLSLLAFIGAGSAKMLQLRENLVSGLAGFGFLGSIAIGRPLMLVAWEAAMQRTAQMSEVQIAAVKAAPAFRRFVTVVTLAWGVTLLAQAGLACVLVFALPIGTYLLVSPVTGYGMVGLALLWTFWYALRWRRGILAQGPAPTGSGA